MSSDSPSSTASLSSTNSIESVPVAFKMKSTIADGLLQVSPVGQTRVNISLLPRQRRAKATPAVKFLVQQSVPTATGQQQGRFHDDSCATVCNGAAAAVGRTCIGSGRINAAIEVPESSAASSMPGDQVIVPRATTATASVSASSTRSLQHRLMRLGLPLRMQVQRLLGQMQTATRLETPDDHVKSSALLNASNGSELQDSPAPEPLEESKESESIQQADSPQESLHEVLHEVLQRLRVENSRLCEQELRLRKAALREKTRGQQLRQQERLGLMRRKWLQVEVGLQLKVGLMPLLLAMAIGLVIGKLFLQ